MKRLFSTNRYICYRFTFLLFLVFALMGCDGGSSDSGSSSNIVSGVAAAGSPIMGKVYLKDSSSPSVLKSVDIGTDGSFSFDVKGMSAPYYLNAQGVVGYNNYNLYSFSSNGGTANINILTNLIIAAAAGVADPASVYNQALNISQFQLDIAISSILKLLKSDLSKYNATGINPLRDTIKADHTGIDEFFDNTEIDIDTYTGDATIRDSQTNMTLAETTIEKIGGMLSFSYVPCFADGNAITVEQVRGASSTITPGAKFEVCGTYTLGSRDSAQIIATNLGRSEEEEKFLIKRGSGNFCFIFVVVGLEGSDKLINIGFFPSGGGSPFYFCNQIILD